jgi:AraC-like DNA-binding protein
MKLLFNGEGEYAEGRKFGPACWPHQDILLVKEGGVLLQTSKGEAHLRAGDGVWIPAGLRFEGLAENGRIHMWVLHFRAPKLKPTMFTSQREAGLWVFREGIKSILAEALMKRLHRIYEGDCRWPTDAVNYLPALLAEMSRNSREGSPSDEQWLHDIERWARGCLAEGITVRDIAAHAGLSHSHFCKLFRQRGKVSAGRFLQGLRLEVARNLLLQTSLAIKEIATRAGYSDAVALHHAFVARFRIPPQAFRKMSAGVV